MYTGMREIVPHSPSREAEARGRARCLFASTPSVRVPPASHRPCPDFTQRLIFQRDRHGPIAPTATNQPRKAATSGRGVRVQIVNIAHNVFMSPGNTLSPTDFVQRWAGRELTERASAQAHFIDLCRLLDVPAPTDNRVTDSDY